MRFLFNEFDQKDNFYIRIRKDKAAEVYYNGIEPFKISNNELSNLNECLFVFNSTNISANKNNFISTLKNNREKFYDKFELKAIYFEKGSYGISHEEEFKTALKKVGAVLENGKYKIDGKNLNIEDEYSILKKIWVDCKKSNSNLFKKVKFKFNKKRKELTLEEIKRTVPELVKDYFKYTKPEIEKYYQHLFLLYKDENDLRKKRLFSNKIVKPFEEEYYIVEKKEKVKNNNFGRIDCVFYTDDGEYITDIYLIEIKVDTNVIGGSNGLHKHLLDICHINDMNENFYKDIIDRINDRNEILYKSHTQLKMSKDLKKYFFIVIGRNNSSIEDIEQNIKYLNDEKSSLYKGVKKKINKKYKNEVEPLTKIYEKCLENVDVKLFVDQTKWNVNNTFEPDYKDFTQWIK